MFGCTCGNNEKKYMAINNKINIIPPFGRANKQMIMEHQNKIKMFRGICIMMLILLFPAFNLSLNAQNVTISPTSGKLLAAQTYDGEAGSNLGWSSMWRHNQLALTMTVADDGMLSEGGQLRNPAGNIYLNGANYVIAGGQEPDSYININLPKGYRITGYKMVLLNNLNGQTVQGLDVGTNVTKTVYETSSNFDYNNYLAKTNTMARTDQTTEFVIQRTSMSETDMTNNLYFRIHHVGEDYYAVTIKSLEIYFTAEGTFDANVIPPSAGELSSTGKNAVYSPFTTGKLNLGKITKNSAGNYSYSYKNVTDLTASNVLYEASAGASGTVVDGAGGITSLMVGNKLYYGLKDNTYFAESPTTMKTALGNSVPVGYRIVGAKINYSYGTAQSAGTAQYPTGYFYITYVSGSTTYYFNTSNSFTTTPVKWKITSDGYIYSGTNYLKSDGSTTTAAADATRFSISTNNRIYYTDNRTNYYLVYSGMSRFSRYTNGAATWTAETQTATYTAFTPHDYTLTVYDKTGQTAVQTVNVTSGTADGTVELTGLNNDAVKFVISGVSDGQALVTVDLELQALNPYINSLDVVCHDHDKTPGKTLTQQFTADDFAVAGGTFFFYVPEGFTATDCSFTFENLKSNYGDNTYYGNTTSTHNSRYYFVNSYYYNHNPQQYSTDPNADYTTKIMTEMCGNVPFTFSNIDAVNAGSAPELLEYQFSESAYTSQTPAGTLNTDNAIIALGANDQCYLFTADETRYNIAPTTATEHRSYAYYLMDITLETKNYGASLAWTKVYDSTCYNKNGSDAEDAMYGVKVTATDTETGALVDGYLTAKQISNAINDATKGLGSTGAPTTADQILYVDASDLYSLIVETQSGQTEDDLTTLKNTLAPNSLFYLPTRANYAKENYAKKTASNSFIACGNIVITDRKPFFAPFDITVPATFSAVYNREITVPANGKVASATIMLPFTISTDENGRHTSNECTFTLNKLQETNCLSIDQAVDASATNFSANAHFVPISGVAAANTPYMVKVETAPGDATLSFVISQTGSDIIATPAMTNYVFTGETGTGTIQGGSYTFTNNATYAGKKFTSPQSQNIFYFAKNMYLCSRNLRPQLDLFAYPFRAYFTYTGPNNAKFNSMDVVFGENDDVTTGITNLEGKPDMAISTGKGTVTVTSSVDKTVILYGVNGMKVNETSLKAGETRTIILPAGIYTVNGVKIIVK